MNWILLATPILGVIGVVAGVLSLRYFFPINRDVPSVRDRAEEAAESTAVMIAKVVGAAIRDERRRAVEDMFEAQSANELMEVLRKRA
jgi:hypothetical protein